MTVNYANVDITQQRLRITPIIFGGAEEAWMSDVHAKDLALQGILDISFEADEPTNVRKLWFDVGNPPTGNHGRLKRYDEDLDAWVNLTPSGFKTWLDVSGRQRWWYTSALGTADRPPDAEVLIGDFWEHDTGTDNELSIYRKLGTGNYAWVDLTGGEINEDVLPQTYLHTQAVSSGSWAVVHNLGYHPIIQALDPANSVMTVAVEHTSLNTATLTVTPASAGTARCV